MQKVFYDAVSGKQIIDVSGIKTKTHIAIEFNIAEKDLQELSINEMTEGVTVIEGLLVKKDLAAEKASIEATKVARQKPAIDKLKALGWTDSEINALLGK